MDSQVVNGVILLGGPSKSTHFRPLSLDIPKPLISVAGIEMITHQIFAMSKIPGLKTIYLLGFYEEGSFKPFMRSVEKTFDIKCKYLNEEKSYGTAGGLYLYRKELFNDNATIVLAHSDVCCNFPLSDMLEFHRKHGKHCTILGTNVPSETSQRYGCLVQNPETNELIHTAYKPESFISDLINCGVYILDSSMVSYLEEGRKKKSSSIPIASSKDKTLNNLFKMHSIREDSLSLEKDVIMPLAGNQKVYLYALDQTQKGNFWFQIKDFDSLISSAIKYMEHYRDVDGAILDVCTDIKNISSSNVIIHPSSEVDPTAKIGSNVTIGAGVKIGAGVRIKNAIILDGVEIYPHCCIMNTIIGWNSIIGSWTRIEGTSRPNSKESLCILGVGVAIDPELCIRNCIVLPYKELSENHANEIIL